MKLFGIRVRRRSGGLTVIDAHLTIRGDIHTEGIVRVDGRIEGEAHRVGTLIVGRNGSVVGNVEANEVIIAGIIEGNVHSTGRTEIEPGAAVHGDVRGGAVVLREGGILHGHVAVTGVHPAESDRAPSGSPALAA